MGISCDSLDIVQKANLSHTLFQPPVTLLGTKSGRPHYFSSGERLPSYTGVVQAPAGLPGSVLFTKV